jgi:hypothetical protein
MKNELEKQNLLMKNELEKQNLLMKNELEKQNQKLQELEQRTTCLEMGQIASLFKEKIKKHVFLENQQVEL